MITVRPATRLDIEAFYNQKPPVTMRAWVAADEQDQPLGIGGYYFREGVAVVFTDHKPELSKKDRVRSARIFMEIIKKLSMEIVATCPEGVGTAMRHFGFEPCGPVWRLVR